MLDSRSVSRLHALIQRRDAGDLSLVDLGSRNGSFVNGTRVSFPVTLNDNDKLLFGDQPLTFRNPARSDYVLSASAMDLRNEPTTALHTNSNTTTLVVDIRDFTPMARSLPEALLSQTIGTWFLRSGQVVQRLGSWAQKYIGDAVMAVWVHDRPERGSGYPARSAGRKRDQHGHGGDQQDAGATGPVANRCGREHRSGNPGRHGLHRAGRHRQCGVPA
jgi:adenylate cyclase